MWDLILAVFLFPVYKEYVHSVAVYQKYLTRLGELINFRALARKLSFLPIELAIFDIRQHYTCEFSIYLSTSDLLRFIISYTDKHEFSRIWKWISCSNDVIYHVECVIKRDVYPQKMHSCSKNIRGISFFLNIRGISRKNIS